VTAVAMTTSMILTKVLSVAKKIANSIVPHKSVIVLILSLMGIPSLERYERIYGPRCLCLSNHLSLVWDDFM